MEKNAVSGKERHGKSWINENERRSQDEFIEKSKEIGRSDNLFGRMDLEGEEPTLESASPDDSLSVEQVLEALTRSPEVDAAEVEVKINGTVVILSGEVEDKEEARAMTKIIENLHGVSDVENNLTFN